MSSIKDVLVPPNEEGTRATILKWCKAVGDNVVKDEPLVELETDKVTVEIPAPASGTLIEVLKPESAEVSPDEVLARLQLPVEATSAAEFEAPAPATKVETSRAPANARAESELLSPSVRRLLHEHAIAPSAINGTGRNGRVTAQDVTRHVSQAAHVSPGDAATLVPHSAIRRRVAQHMVRSLSEAPHVTTLFEADLGRVLKHRALHAKSFESRGARLTLTAYFISACIRALRTHPEVNATFREDAMELHSDVNIGVGTALGEKGLIVPVIHRAQDLNLFRNRAASASSGGGGPRRQAIAAGCARRHLHDLESRRRRQPARRAHCDQSAASGHSRGRQGATPRLRHRRGRQRVHCCALHVLSHADH